MGRYPLSSYDHARDELCRVHLAADGRSPCLPLFGAGFVLGVGPRCDEQVVVERADTTFYRSLEETACFPRLDEVFRAGAIVEASAGAERCVGVPLDGILRAPVPVEPDELAYLETDVLIGGGRLRRYTNRGESVARLTPGHGRFFDSTLAVDCEPALRGDVFRCLPTAARPLGGAFADPACTEPATARLRPSCAGWYYALEEDGVTRGTFYREGEPADALFFVQDGACVRSDVLTEPPVWLEPVSDETFAAFRRVTR